MAPEALGTAQEALGTVQEALGTVQEALGMVQEALGTAQEALGTVQEALGTVQEALGTVQEALGTVQEHNFTKLYRDILVYLSIQSRFVQTRYCLILFGLNAALIRLFSRPQGHNVIQLEEFNNVQSNKKYRPTFV